MLAFLGAEHQMTLLAPEGSSAPEGALSFQLETYRQTRAGQVAGLWASLRHGYPGQSGLFYQPDLSRRLREILPEQDAAVLQLVRLAPHLGDFQETPLLVDLIDSLALSWQRRAALAPPWARPLFNLEARRLERWERRLVLASQGSLVVCQRDRRAVLEGLPAEAKSRLDAVPLAFPLREPLSAESGHGGSVATEIAAAETPTVVFTGNLGYFPNADAATWLVRELWPRVQTRCPEAQLFVAGDRPAAVVRKAIRQARSVGLRVQLMAEPTDLVGILARGTLAVAPLRGGAGQPLKILEAWARGVPMMASTWAAAGLPPQASGALFSLPMDSGAPEAWCRELVALLESATRRRQLAAAGKRALAEHYRPETIQKHLLTWAATCLDFPRTDAE